MTTPCQSGREDVFSTPKFFKVIVDPLADMRIPVEFMKRHGRNLGNRAFLRVPNRKEWWEVDLIHSNGETVLQKGWKEFSEHYSLRFGHFLMFEYNGHSQFDVLICDKSACEIDYPSGSDSQVEGSGTDSIVVLEHLSSRKRDSDTRVPRTRMKLEESSSTDDRVPKTKKKAALEKETSMAYQKALAFEAAQPFFISFMQPSYVDRFDLEVPRTFVRDNMFAHGNTDLTLGIKNDDKKVWPIKLHCFSNRGTLGGWKDFVKDNGLKVGDVCIFEVVNNSHWNVIIFRS